MAEITKIEWADATANFWIGCTKLSAACDNCYAEADWDKRKHRVTWGPHGARDFCKSGEQVVRKMQRHAPVFRFDHGRKPRIFVNSLSDWADNHRSIRPEWRERIFECARECPDVILMLLTKRPQNIAQYLPADWGDGYPNVWLGTTVENQAEADRRIPHLLATPAAVRFLSCEPLLSPVDLTMIQFPNARGGMECWDALDLHSIEGEPMPEGNCEATLDWVIAGGESGPNARPMQPDWARSLRDQCWDAAVPFFFKQWGEWAPGDAFGMQSDGPVTDRHGNVRDWMNRYIVCADRADRVRSHSFTRHATELVYRIGKARAGRLLDGFEHSDFPA